MKKKDKLLRFLEKRRIVAFNEILLRHASPLVPRSSPLPSVLFPLDSRLSALDSSLYPRSDRPLRPAKPVPCSRIPLRQLLIELRSPLSRNEIIKESSI